VLRKEEKGGDRDWVQRKARQLHQRGAMMRRSRLVKTDQKKKKKKKSAKRSTGQDQRDASRRVLRDIGTRRVEKIQSVPLTPQGRLEKQKTR